MSNANSFIDQVRAGRVRQPNQRGFEPERWTRAFAAVSNPTLRDASLYASGLVAHLVFSEVRARVERIGPLPMSRSDEAQLMCAVVNRDVWQADAILRGHLEERVANEGGLNVQAVYDRVLQAVGGENALDLGQAIETSIDGGTHPLRSAIKGWVSGEPTMAPSDDLRIIGATQVLYLVGQLYAWLELVWRRCVYGNEELVIEAERWVFRPIDAAAARRRTLSAHRDEAMIMQRARQVDQELSLMPEVSRKVRERRVLLRAGRHPPYRVRLGTARGKRTGQVDAAEWLRGRLMFEASYPAALLTTPLAAYGGLTAETMLRAWEALAPFVSQVNESFEHPKVIDTVEGLRAFAPPLSEASLVAGWTRALGIQRDQALALVKAFTFRGEPRDTLWSRPLVRLGDGQLAFAVSAITSPNVRWLIETWLRSGGLDLDERGAWFETDVHREVRSGLSGSPLGDVWVSDGVVTLSGTPAHPEAPETEEIDLLVRIGATVLVCEIKCSLVPMDDVVAEMNYRATLAKGARQALRKARFLVRNQDLSAQVVGTDGEPSDLRFLPVLVTNVAAGVGQSVEGVPVTDASLLRQYIQFGYYLRMASQRPDGSYDGERHAFYDGDEDAEACVLDYLRDPPQITVFEPLLRDVEMQIATVTGRELIQRYPVIEAPQAPA